MTQASPSETLFKPRLKHPETSTLVHCFNRDVQSPVQSALDGETIPHWYRMINRLTWIWHGVDPREILDVQACIVVSDAERTDNDLYDTVIGYRGGSWICGWAAQTMVWQQKACTEEDPQLSGRHWLHVATLYNIAAYPHLKGDNLAERIQALSNHAHEEAVQRLPGTIQQMRFTVPGGVPITGFLHMSEGDGPFPTVLMYGGLGTAQMNYYSLYERYSAPRGITMLTIDISPVGFSSKWKLTQNSNLLRQHVLRTLLNVPWVDHTHVVAFGFRFSANVAVHLAYPESPRLEAVTCLGSVTHTLLNDFECQQQVSKTYPDILTSRLGVHDAFDETLRIELSRYSLKMQGLLERRCPTPMLSGCQKNDPFSPEEDSCLIMSPSAGGKLLETPFNPVYQNFSKGLQEITNWIEERLC